MNVSNGTVLTPEGTVYGSLVAVICDNGFVIKGDTLVRCQAHQNWSDYPECIKGEIFLAMSLIWCYFKHFLYCYDIMYAPAN